VNRTNEIESTKAAVYTLLLILGLTYFVWSIVMLFSTNNITIDTIGSFGSSISGLFAGAAAFLVYRTLSVQKRELEETRQELKNTREQQHIRAIEESFYNQLNLLSQSRNSLVITEGSKEYKGREVVDLGIQQAVNLYRNHVNKYHNVLTNGIKSEDQQAFYNAFNVLGFEEQQAIIRDLRKHIKHYGGEVAGPLFFLNATIVGFIEDNRQKFADNGIWMEKLLKSQLTISEVQFLYWQAIIVQPPLIPQHSFLLKSLSPIPEFFFFDISKMKDIPDNFVEVFTTR